ncbi:Os06g0528350 [Oryza sativa Japonica Group]|uniref:Os06g0528350 protein n=2 Tax=Oryza sativa subsp. japonica TaxID=39947 RepID=C7J3W5_ORYSJ|nr:hypothetical protein EE612_034601 [Oryza sativa]KAF2927051.1 hypothetical protein DAI22_06g173700 [Oryza sativa Japonica Group]BAH93559.1 Os06g0528350 [Oryza sativa Japonica Group]BAS98050.1 Os06g0528350 [Oryza sativa Japonica Group]|eukprot:NP_001174831.1 Os06g0528350 [Oryza sativa Japonica Group]
MISILHRPAISMSLVFHYHQIKADSFVYSRMDGAWVGWGWMATNPSPAPIHPSLPPRRCTAASLTLPPLLPFASSSCNPWPRPPDPRARRGEDEL